MSLERGIHPISSLPAFEAGWENISLEKHKPFLPEGFSKRLQYYGTCNPSQAYKLLENMAVESERLVLAPFGTKPSTLAAVVFLINKSSEARRNGERSTIGAVYDFPQKNQSRSSGVKETFVYRMSVG